MLSEKPFGKPASANSLAEIDVGIWTEGDVDHDRVGIRADRAVHAGVINDLQVDLDPDLRELGLHRFIETHVCTHH